MVHADRGEDITVRFQPHGDRPGHCSDCFSKRRTAVGMDWQGPAVET
ncbi:MAG: hypothetical protein O6920_02965 [Chloroflexi bacterium]|nr:hypothetical protein [Chloroflexota bacterium]